jgi:hypothetical protein
MKKQFKKSALPQIIAWLAGAIADIKGEMVTVEVKTYRKKRSLDANAYCWCLIDKLAEKLGSTIKTDGDSAKETIYKNAIRDIGGVSDTVCVPSDAAQRIIDGWQSKGIGWQAEAFKSKLKGCTNITLYYGSSTYDTKQMSRLIDSLVQDCQAQGIETMPPDELQSLIGKWGDANE